MTSWILWSPRAHIRTTLLRDRTLSLNLEDSLNLGSYRCVLTACCSESNRVEMDENDTVSQLNFTYSSVKAIVS